MNVNWTEFLADCKESFAQFKLLFFDYWWLWILIIILAVFLLWLVKQLLRLAGWFSN